MSRLARSCKDWHVLLELCAIYRTLLADTDGVYDPADQNDRLVLGLKGTMSEAELHVLKNRLQQGRWNKALRGELLTQPPMGYLRTPAGDFVLDPDEQAWGVIRLIFSQFPRQQSVNGLLRWLVQHQVKLPIRPHFGERQGELQWRRPNRVTLLNLLRHPIHAGAYRYGHRQVDPRRKKPGRVGTGRTQTARHRSPVRIQDRFPAYISWEQFEQNQRLLDANRTMGLFLSAPRQGPSVLAGLIVCGRCGQRMMVGYGQQSELKWLRYSCQRRTIDYGEEPCQNLAGATLEAYVAEQLLQAVSAASLELSLAASADIHQKRRELEAHWQQRLQRSAYEVEQAWRQYAAVDPEHRLVARELERRWEQALQSRELLQADYARFQQDCPARLSSQEQEQISQLARDLPALWSAEATTSQDRQQIVRLLLEQVIVTVEGDTDRVEVELRWAGGFVSRGLFYRTVQTYRQLSNYEQLLARIEELRSGGQTLAAIARTVTEEGFRPPKRTQRFTGEMLGKLLRDLAVQSGQRSDSVTHNSLLNPGEWWLAELAGELQMPIASLHRWRRAGWERARKV